MSTDVKIQRLDSGSANFQQTLLASLSIPLAEDTAIDLKVAEIILAIQNQGDHALLRYTSQFDRLQAQTASALEILPSELKNAYTQLSNEQSQALNNAAARIQTTMISSLPMRAVKAGNTPKQMARGWDKK